MMTPDMKNSYLLFRAQESGNVEQFMRLIHEHEREDIQDALDRTPFCPLEGKVIHHPRLIQALVDDDFRVIPTQILDHDHMAKVLGHFTSTSDYDKRMFRYLIELGAKPSTDSVAKACQNNNLPLVRELAEEWGLVCNAYFMGPILNNKCDELLCLLSACLRLNPLIVIDLGEKLTIQVFNHSAPSDGTLVRVLEEYISTMVHQGGGDRCFENTIARYISVEGRIAVLNDSSTSKSVRDVILRIMDEV